MGGLFVTYKFVTYKFGTYKFGTANSEPQNLQIRNRKFGTYKFGTANSELTNSEPLSHARFSSKNTNLYFGLG